MRSVTCFQQLVRPCLASFIVDIHLSKQACVCWGHAAGLENNTISMMLEVCKIYLMTNHTQTCDFYYLPSYKRGNRGSWQMRVLSSHTRSQWGSQELSSRCLYAIVPDDQEPANKDTGVVLGLPYNYHPELNKRRLKVLVNHTHLSQSLVNLCLPPTPPAW